MRRERQALQTEECEAILERNTSGILALASLQAKPYALPLSYVYADGAIYFHCAQEGKKMDLIRKNPEASFCVVDLDDVVQELFTTRFLSVIVQGTIEVVEDEEVRKGALMLLSYKYSPDLQEEVIAKHVKRDGRHACVLKLNIEEISGKMAKEIMKEREQQ